MAILQDVQGFRDTFAVRIEEKRLFFDTAKVIDAIGKPRAAILSRFGAFVRRRARSSIRSGGKSNIVSAPGDPPRWHSPEPNLRTILFFYEALRGYVIIGPLLFNHMPTSSLVRGVIPAALERGGTLDLIQRKVRGNWVNGRPRRGSRWQETRVKSVTIRARPFMLPALRAEAPGFPALWQDCLGKSPTRVAA